MPLDPRAKRFLDVLAATNPPSALGLSVAERREGLAQLMRFSGPPEPVEYAEDRSFPGEASSLPMRLYTPLGADDTQIPGLVYFHGGGLVAGSVATHDGIARALANASGCRIASIDYRLAPEHRFPAALSDALAAVRYVCLHATELGVEPGKVIVCGDSAGATLAAVVCQQLARSGGPQPLLQLLLCPILDYGDRTQSRREFGAGYLVDEATLSHDLRHYLPKGTSPSDPRVSPLTSDDLSGVAPAAIHTAECDPLRDEGKAYADRLLGSGIAVSYTCHPGMIHLFYGLAGVIPYAKTAFAQIGSDIRAALK